MVWCFETRGEKSFLSSLCVVQTVANEHVTRVLASLYCLSNTRWLDQEKTGDYIELQVFLYFCGRFLLMSSWKEFLFITQQLLMGLPASFHS